MTFSSQLGCPVKCDCDYRAYNMSCNSTDLTRFPLNMVWCPENLAMVDNNIETIENGSFSPCGSTIITLNLRNAGIMVIEDGAFDEFSKILTLDLRDNKVKEIQESIFKGMTNIATIYFQNNLIESARGRKLTYDITETSKAVLYLNNNKLKKIEAMLPKGIDTMYLDDNDISEITPDFAVFPLITLNGLSLRGNRIKTIQRRAFVGLTNVTWFQNEDSPLKKLTYITLDDNIIEDIEPFAFEGLPAVKCINISGNNLKKLKPNMFRALTSLNLLCLINSNVETVEPETFRDLDALVELNLSNNRIEALEDEVFLDLPLLKVLNVSHNRIQTIKMEIFTGLHMLKTLNLSFNDITYLKTASFANLHNLELLDLSHNKIVTTEADAFQNVPHLEKLILDYNEIIKVQPLSFQKLPNLRELSFKHNKITSLSPQLDQKLNILRTDMYLRGNTVQVPEPKEKMSLKGLLILDLSHNHLQDLPPGVFKETGKLFSLRLKHNKFQFLRSGALIGLRELNELDLHNNPLKCDCAMLGTYIYTTRNKIDTKLFHESQPICMAPEKHKNKQWDVLESIYNLSACQPVQPLAAAYQVALFVVGPILLITVGILTYYFQSIMRKIM
jgi:insulin-like growth factor-binding protein complex acid labile subunit